MLQLFGRQAGQTLPWQQRWVKSSALRHHPRRALRRGVRPRLALPSETGAQELVMNGHLRHRKSSRSSDWRTTERQRVPALPRDHGRFARSIFQTCSDHVSRGGHGHA
jgi:hypothetical protein